MIRPFTIRYRRAILDRKIRVAFSVRLRRRLWRLMERYQSWWQEPDHTGWVSDTSTLSETEVRLQELYGVEELGTPGEQARTPVKDFEEFFFGTYPSEVLDVIEVFHALTPDDSTKASFTNEVNQAFLDEEAPWRLAAGQFFEVDSSFLKQSLLAAAQGGLSQSGFEGAHDELQEARRDLQAGDFKGAILNACKSFESTLKSALNVEKGNASVLVGKAKESDLLKDLPDGVEGGFASQVLLSLPFLRNTLGGHGQGREVVEVTRPYAELAVHLAATLNLFLINQNSGVAEEDGVPPQTEESKIVEPDDDLPF